MSDSSDDAWIAISRFLGPPTMDLRNSNDHLVDEAPLDAEHEVSAAVLRQREGLPASYRMRADKHYVEQLDAGPGDRVIRGVSVASIELPTEIPREGSSALAKSVGRHGVLQPLLVQRRNGRTRLIDGRRRLQAAIASGFREVPCIVHDVDDAEALLLAQQANGVQSRVNESGAQPAHASSLDIADSVMKAVTAIDATTRLISGSSLAERVGIDLIRAEAWRAVTLLEAAAVVRHGLPHGQSACRALHLMTAVTGRAELECRLRGLPFRADSDVPANVTVVGNPKVLETGLSGLLLATMAMIEGRSGARVVCTASRETTHQVTFVVSSIGVLPPPSWASGALDPAKTDGPGGAAAVVWLQAARIIAEGYGGAMTVAAFSGGTSMTINIPQPVD
jgi:hypothetical protein